VHVNLKNDLHTEGNSTKYYYKWSKNQQINISLIQTVNPEA